MGQISLLGRATQGVRIINVSEGESVASVARMAEKDPTEGVPAVIPEGEELEEDPSEILDEGAEDEAPSDEGQVDEGSEDGEGSDEPNTEE